MKPSWVCAALSGLLIFGCGSDPSSTSDAGSGSASVEGQVSFFSLSDPSSITVSAPAAGTSTQAEPDGSFRLSVPPGNWDIYAQAPHYPRQRIGRVTVDRGETATLPAYGLSLYTPLPTLGVEGGYWRLVDGLPSRFEDRSAVLLELVPPSGPSAYYAFDLTSSTLRFICSGIKPTISLDGRRAAIPSGATLLIRDLETAQAFTVSISEEERFWHFSEDDTVLFGETASPQGTFHVIHLVDQTETSFDSLRRIRLGADRYLVDTGQSPVSWKLVTPTSTVSVFANVSNVWSVCDDGTHCFAYGVESCEDASSACPLVVLPPGASETVDVPVRAVATASDPWFLSSPGSIGSWLILDGFNGTTLRTAEGESIAVAADVEGGTATLLPPDADHLAISPGGSSLAFTTDGGRKLFVHEVSTLDPDTLEPVLASTSVLTWEWTSGSRVVAFDEAADPPSVVLIEAGEVAQRLDYQPGSKWLGLQAVSWAAPDGSVRMLGGTSPVVQAPPGYTDIPAVFAEHPSGGQLLAYWGDLRLWAFRGGELEPLAGLSPGFTVRGIYAGMFCARDIQNRPVVVDVTTGQRIALREPGYPGALTFDVDRDDTFLLAVGQSSTGEPEGGGFAVLPTPFVDLLLPPP